MYGAPMIGVSIWWVVDAHGWFKGPKVNIEHQMLGREVSSIEGDIIGDGDGESSSIVESMPITDGNKKLSADDFA